MSIEGAILIWLSGVIVGSWLTARVMDRGPYGNPYGDPELGPPEQ